MPFVGTHIAFWQQNSLEPQGTASFIPSHADWSYEVRVRFPGPTNTLMPPTQVNGGILTVSSGTTPVPVGDPAVWSLWYEKPYGVTSTTGNLYVTSSAGRLQITSASIFNDTFYNLAFVKEHQTGSVTLYVTQYIDDQLTYATSSYAASGAVGYPTDAVYTMVEIGSSSFPGYGSSGQFWAQEFRWWTASLNQFEVRAHAAHFESYGRDISWKNEDLLVHLRMNDGVSANANGNVYLVDSVPNGFVGTGSNFTPNANPFTRFLEDYAYIPSIDYGWNQQKIRIYSGSTVDPTGSYSDERFVSLEFNMYDALNEDISQMMTSYDELNNFLGLPMNRYRESYEGLQQMRETYFKRLQGKLDLNLFVSMLDFFDQSFVTVVERLLPARTIFKGDEIVVESHLLERPKYQYGIRPVREGFIDISGSISVTDLWGSIFR